MQKHNGTSLIEILVSLILLSFILLSFEAIQLSALHAMKDAYHFTIAHQQLLTMAEKIKSNKNIDREEVHAWQVQNQTMLPQGRGMIRGESPVFNLSIRWGKDKSSECRHLIGQAGCLQLPIHL